jgi:CheY-like chemotaxis protein
MAAVEPDVREIQGPAAPDTQRCMPPELARILIVDDEEKLGRLLRRLLAESDVEVANSGKQALDRIRGGERFNVILCDVGMPGMNGCDLFDEIQKCDPEQAKHVAFFTGGACDDRTERRLQASSQPVLCKPVAMSDIFAVIKTFVE